jgi:hypothetical protein
VGKTALKECLMKDRKLLMIPGPIEFEPAVIRAYGCIHDGDLLATIGAVETGLYQCGYPFDLGDRCRGSTGRIADE